MARDKSLLTDEQWTIIEPLLPVVIAETGSLRRSGSGGSLKPIRKVQ